MREDLYEDLRDDPETLDALATLEGLPSDYEYAEDADAVIDVARVDAAANERRMYSGLVEEGGGGTGEEPVSGPFRDDFTEMRIRQAAAREEYPRDDLAQQAAVDRARVEALAARAQEAPKIPGMPPTWTRGVIGGSATVSPGQQPQEVATWIGEDAESRSVSVAFGPSSQATSGGSGSDTLRPFVRLQFGTERGLITVDVDVGTGGQVSLPGSIVHALVGLDSGGSLSYGLTVVMGYFPIVRSVPVTRTSYADSVAAGTASRQNFTRPLFAGSVLFDRADTSAMFTLDFLDLRGNIRYSRVIAAATYLTDPIQLSNDVVSVDVTNNGASTTHARLTWVLCL